MSKNKPGPATKALRGYLQEAGIDPRRWTSEQRTEHAKLSDAAMREQNQTT